MWTLWSVAMFSLAMRVSSSVSFPMSRAELKWAQSYRCSSSTSAQLWEGEAGEGGEGRKRRNGGLRRRRAMRPGRCRRGGRP